MAFLCTDLGSSNEPRPDYAAHVANWFHFFENDNSAIFAATKAQQGADFAHRLQPQLIGAPEPDDGKAPTYTAALGRAGQMTSEFWQIKDKSFQSEVDNLCSEQDLPSVL